MAYSRTPEFNTHKVISIDVGTPPKLDGHVNQYSVMYKNCIPRNIKSAQGSQAYLEKRYGYATSVKFMRDLAGQHTYSDLRGVFISNAKYNSYYCLAMSDDVYINGYSRLTLGTATATRYVGFTEAVVAGVHYIVVLESAGAADYSVVHTINTDSWATASTTLTGIVTTGDPVFMNGRIYVAQAHTHRIYNSAVNSLTTWDTANDYIDAEQVGDTILALGYHRNTLVAFGKTSIEFFKDEAIDVGSPLLRIENYSTGVGLFPVGGTYEFVPTFAYIGSSIFFLGTAEDGSGLFSLSDFSVTKIPNPVLESVMGESNSRQTRLFTLSHRGRLLLLLSNGTSTHYVYDPIDNYTAEWNFYYDDGVGTAPLIKFAVTERFRNTYAEPQKTYLFGCYTSFLADCTALAPEAHTTSIDVEASFVIYGIDDGNTNQKHWKYVDIVGNLNTNTVEMWYNNKEEELTSYSYPPYYSNDSADGFPVRFRNLGRGRKLSLYITFTGTKGISISRIDIAYNLGTI